MRRVVFQARCWGWLPREGGCGEAQDGAGRMAARSGRWRRGAARTLSPRDRAFRRAREVERARGSGRRASRGALGRAYRFLRSPHFGRAFTGPRCDAGMCLCAARVNARVGASTRYGRALGSADRWDARACVSSARLRRRGGAGRGDACATHGLCGRARTLPNLLALRPRVSGSERCGVA